MHYCCDRSLTKPLLAERCSEKEPKKGRHHRKNPVPNNNTQNYSTADTSSVELDTFSGCESEDDDVAFSEKRVSYLASFGTVLLVVQVMLKQISLLVWKNLLFRRRHYIVTGLEVILPTLFAILIAYLRTIIPEGQTIDTIHNTTFPLVSEKVSLEHAGKVFSSSCVKCTLAYAPNNSVTDNIMGHVKKNLGGNFELRGFKNENEIELYMAQLGLDINRTNSAPTFEQMDIKAAIIFDKGTDSFNFRKGHTISYKIRLVDVMPLENTEELFPWFQIPGPNEVNAVNYENAGFIGLQIATDKAVMEILTGLEPSQTINIQAFPYPPYTQSINFNQIYFIILPQFMVLGFIFIVPSLVLNIVSEKETGIKELVKMMGLPNWMHWLGWMLNSLLVLTLSITILTALFFIPFDSKAGAVMIYTDPTLWWFVLFLYCMAATSFCFLISTFFQRPTLATTVGIVLWLVSYYAPVQTMEQKYRSLSINEKMISALLPNVALHWVIKVMCGFEGKSIGARWSNIADPVSSVDELSVLNLCIMLVLDTVLYILLTIYFESIIPSEFGVRKPWYYIFKLSTWRCGNSYNRSRICSTAMSGDIDDRRGFESEPSDLTAGIVIRNLTKRFGRNKVAVNGVTLKMYDGQITALLGHNGAGKTTTMSMLTGLFAPTSGTATVNGYDITTDMENVRSNLGLCPQHNMLFDKLTVEEHLIFFGRLKGLTTRQARIEMKSLLDKLQLTEKRKTLAAAISGGQKRKLSLGIALIGGTKVVILDEPTSGMDPEARRAIWDLLLEMRGERTILLTTHFMEEADVLGDRIAIMTEGNVKCCGSPMFLKKYYGAGYTLRLTLGNKDQAIPVLDIVQTHIPNASFKNQNSPNSYEVVITIPNEINTNSLFPQLFTDLSEYKEVFGIKTLGLSLTTMDEVFFKVGEEKGEEFETESNDVETSTLEDGARVTPTDRLYQGRRLEGMKLSFQQFNGMLRKRMLYTLRKRKLFVIQFFIPLSLLVGSILLSNKTFSPSNTSPPLSMELSTYKNPITLFTSTDKVLGDAFRQIVGSSAVELSAGYDGGLNGHLVFVGAKDLGAYREKYIVAGDLTASNLTAMFSTIPNHAPPLSVNLMSNTILQTLSRNQDYGIKVTSHPLKSGMNSLLEPANPNPVFATQVPILFGVLLPIGLSLFAASYIVFPVEEKVCKAKQLQLMTGVSPLIFWGSSFVWDFCVMTILICLMVSCFPIFQTYSAFTVYNGGGVIFLILLVYGFSAISFSYLCSLFVSTVSGGFSMVTITHILTGMIMSLVVFLLEMSGEVNAMSHVRSIGRLFPTFGASISIMRFTSIATKNSRCNILSETIKDLICNPAVQIQPELRQCCPNCASFANPDGPSCFEPESYLTWTQKQGNQLFPTSVTSDVPGIGQDLFYLLLIGIFYKVLLIVIEYGFVKRLLALIFKSNLSTFRTQPLDEDVMIENQRVAALTNAGKVGDDALVVENLCKSYGSFAAVSGLSFGVHHGECFGLLGVNGAGKTTSFRMLTGDEFRSNGNAFAMNYALESQQRHFLSNIGYCPQFDGIVGVLTGKEMLELFCRLRGVEPDAVKRESHKWLQKLGLLESGNVQCQKYSGGMKRRLSAAMALIGDSPIILLDEPTTGVDPIARHQFWNVISSVRESGQAVVLTSHSMEECEALCSRLGIMVNGQFQCLGDVQHLKNKFAQGYSLLIKLKPLYGLDSPEVNSLCGEISIRFNPCSLKDKHQNMLQYQILDTSMSWVKFFTSMEDLKTEYEGVIEDYSVSETTLEEVFLSFARKQYPNRNADVSFFRKLVTCQCSQ